MATEHPRRVLRAPHTLRTALAVMLGLGAAFVGGMPTQATPGVAEIERQIDQAWEQLEPVIEQHNKTAEDLAKRKKLAAEYGTKIKPLAAKVDAAMGKVGALAAIRYKGGDASAMNSLLEHGTPDELMRRLSTLDQFAKKQDEQVKGVKTLKDSYDAKKAPLDAMIVELTKTEAQQAAKAKQINADIKRLEKMRIAAYGSGGSGGGSLRPVLCPPSYPGGAAGKAISFACRQISKPYVWGATGPRSYDCSGLTLSAWAAGGVSLRRTADEQQNSIRSVSRSELRAGDLVFYGSPAHHVAIYAGRIGGTDWVVHAPQSGDVVRMATLDMMPVSGFGRPGA